MVPALSSLRAAQRADLEPKPAKGSAGRVAASGGEHGAEHHLRNMAMFLKGPFGGHHGRDSCLVDIMVGIHVHQSLLRWFPIKIHGHVNVSSVCFYVLSPINSTFPTTFHGHM